MIVQNMQGFGQGWSRDAQLFWRAPDPVETPIRNWPRLQVNLQAPSGGAYALAVRYTQAPDYGDLIVFVRGAEVGRLDGYAPKVRPVRRELGQVNLE